MCGVDTVKGFGLTVLCHVLLHSCHLQSVALREKIKLLKRWLTSAKSHIQGESENG